MTQNTDRRGPNTGPSDSHDPRASGGQVKCIVSVLHCSDIWVHGARHERVVFCVCACVCVLILGFVSGFKEVLVVGVYLLSIIHIPARTWGAPARLRGSRSSNSHYYKMAGRWDSEPAWYNPCGSGTAANISLPTDAGAVATVSDADLYNRIIDQASRALGSAKEFKDKYVSSQCLYVQAFVIRALLNL